LNDPRAETRQPNWWTLATHQGREIEIFSFLLLVLFTQIRADLQIRVGGLRETQFGTPVNHLFSQIDDMSFLTPPHGLDGEESTRKWMDGEA